MALTTEQVATALNAAGIDSPEKLIAFLRPAAIATETRRLEAQVAKIEAEHLAAQQAAQAAHNAAVTALRDQIEALNEALKEE